MFQSLNHTKSSSRGRCSQKGSWASVSRDGRSGSRESVIEFAEVGKKPDFRSQKRSHRGLVFLLSAQRRVKP